MIKKRPISNVILRAGLFQSCIVDFLRNKPSNELRACRHWDTTRKKPSGWLREYPAAILSTPLIDTYIDRSATDECIPWVWSAVKNVTAAIGKKRTNWLCVHHREGEKNSRKLPLSLSLARSLGDRPRTRINADCQESGWIFPLINEEMTISWHWERNNQVITITLTYWD